MLSDNSRVSTPQQEPDTSPVHRRDSAVPPSAVDGEAERSDSRGDGAEVAKDSVSAAQAKVCRASLHLLNHTFDAHSSFTVEELTTSSFGSPCSTTRFSRKRCHSAINTTTTLH